MQLLSYSAFITNVRLKIYLGTHKYETDRHSDLALGKANKHITNSVELYSEGKKRTALDHWDRMTTSGQQSNTGQSRMGDDEVRQSGTEWIRRD